MIKFYEAHHSGKNIVEAKSEVEQGERRMTDITMESLMQKLNSRYKLVVLASKRTLELSEGRERLTEASPNLKLSAVAIKEIQEGKVTYRAKEAK